MGFSRISDYFYQKLHLRGLTGFWMHLCYFYMSMFETTVNNTLVNLINWYNDYDTKVWDKPMLVRAWGVHRLLQKQ